MEAASRGEVMTPYGAPVGPARLRGLGILLGHSGGSDELHHLLERDPGSARFRFDLAAALPLSAREPLYAVVHESCWADGGATCRAAERALPAAFADDPTLLTGEHLVHAALAKDPLLAPWRPVADALAEHEWLRLYDEAALRDADVPGAAAVYARDTYVPMALSLETAALMPRLRTWVTSECEHNGLRASGGAVCERLDALAMGGLMR